MTSAIAAEATRGVSPGTPATRPPRHRARHVERQQQRACRSARRCRTWRRTPRPARRRPRCTGSQCPAARAVAVGVGAQRRQHRDRVDARPAEPVRVAEPVDHRRACRPSPARARRRGSSSPGCGSAPSSACRASSASQTSAERRCSGRHASRGRPVLADRAAPPRRRRRPLGPLEAAHDRAAGRPASRPRTIHSTSRACSAETSTPGCRSRPPPRVGQAQQVAVVTSRRAAGTSPPGRPSVVGRPGGVPARPRPGAARGPSRGSPRRSPRSGTGACRCGATRGSASSAARRVAASPSAGGQRQREQRRVVLRRAARPPRSGRSRRRCAGRPRPGSAATARGVLARELRSVA